MRILALSLIGLSASRNLLDSQSQLTYTYYADNQLERTFTPVGYIDGTSGCHYAYIRDHQGNNRATLSADGWHTSVMKYYPFGAATWHGDQADRYRFGGKELDRTLGLDLYDFEARMYDPVLARFCQPDPMAWKYTWLSPYAYCANNPIRYIDPSGMDIWTLDEKGYVKSKESNTKIDKFILVNKAGKIRTDENGKELSQSFTYGTIQDRKPITFSKDGSYDTYKVRGDDNAKRLFEFLSDNLCPESRIEFSLVQTGIEGDKGLNFISTGHVRGSEPGMSYLFRDQLQNGYHIRAMIHSHPLDDEFGRNDSKFVSQITNWYKRNKYTPVQLRIYHVPTHKYIDYKNEKK